MERLEVRKYDAIIIGAGQAGIPLAKKLSGEGWKIAVVERENEGGSRINYGYTPTKAMISSAEAAFIVKNSINWGLNVSGNAIDFDQVIRRRDRIVDQFRNGIRQFLETNENVDFYRATASFTDSYTIRVKFNDEEKDELLLSSKKIFINTGNEPGIPDIKGLDNIPYYTFKSWINIQKIPKMLAIIGGGNVGVEFAQMFSRLGSKVMIFQNTEQLLPLEDEDIARELLEIFRDEGIDIHLNSQIESFKVIDEETFEIGFSEGSMKRSLNVTHVLIATGSEAATKALNLKKAGIDFTEKGYIVTNDFLEASTAGIYAMGDCRYGPEVTHTSFDDYRIISDHLFGAKKRKLSDRIVAFTLFTDPQLGRVGLNENQCIKKGVSYRKAILKADKIARAIETNRSRGLIKVLIGEDDKILGASVILNQGGELAALIQTAMMGGLKYQTLRDSVFPHPTYAESVENLFANIV